jgi:hypothetical protein
MTEALPNPGHKNKLSLKELSNAEKDGPVMFALRGVAMKKVADIGEDGEMNGVMPW